MFRQKLVLIVLLFLLPCALLAQVSLDSLHSSLFNSPAEHFSTIQSLHKSYKKHDFSEAITQTNDLLNKAHLLQKTRLIPCLYVLLGRVYADHNEVAKGIEYAKTGIEYAQSHNLTAELAFSKEWAGRIFAEHAMPEWAISYWIEAAEHYQQAANDQQAAHLFSKIGDNFFTSKEYVKARIYYQKALAFHKKAQSDWHIKHFSNNIGLTLSREGKYETALEFYLLALETAQAMKDSTSIGFISGNMGVVYHEQKRYAMAERYYKTDIDLSKKSALWTSLGNAFVALANLYQETGQLAFAQRHYDSAAFYIHKHQLSNSLPALYQGLTKIHKQKKQYEQAFFYYQKYIDVRDSIAADRKSESLAKMEAVYQYEKQRGHIDLLTKEGEYKETLISKQSKWIWGMGATLITILGLAVGLLRANYQRRKMNAVLKDKRALIAEKNKKLEEANEEVKTINTNLEVLVEERTIELNRINAELDAFLYHSSHDLRRPLTTLMGLTSIVKLSSDTATFQEILPNIDHTILEMDKMLFKLRMVSYIADTSWHKIAQIDFERILQSVYTRLSSLIEASEMDYQTQIDTQTPYVSSPILFQIILYNLIENSVHFRHNENPSLRVFIDEFENQLRIRVQDNGQGIQKDYQKLIYEMYTRGSDASKGNGLGLYVVKKAVKALHGKISLESQPKVETVFTVLLPFKS